MSPSKFPGYIFELLAMHEMFRRLKFPADDLFVVIGMNEAGTDEGTLYVQFHCKVMRPTHPSKPPREELFVIDVTSFRGRVVEVRAMWEAARSWWCSPTTTDYERDMVMDATEVFGRSASLVAALAGRSLLPSQRGA